MSDQKQPGLFDAGRAARDDALERVEKGAPMQWKDLAEKVVRLFASKGEPFTSDDLWQYGLPKPREPRALGAIMAKLARRGIIRKTGRYLPCRSATRHVAPVAEWIGA